MRCFVVWGDWIMFYFTKKIIALWTQVIGWCSSLVGVQTGVFCMGNLLLFRAIIKCLQLMLSDKRMWSTAPLRNTKAAHGCVYRKYNKFHTVCPPWHMHWGHSWHISIESSPNVILISQLGGRETNLENSGVASRITAVCLLAALWKARNTCLEVVEFTGAWGEGHVNCVYR